MPKPRRCKPRELTPNWPTDPCTTAAGEALRQTVIALQRAIGNQSLRVAAEKIGIDHTVLHGILTGNTWPSVAILAACEIGTNTSLWPGLENYQPEVHRTQHAHKAGNPEAEITKIITTKQREVPGYCGVSQEKTRPQSS